PYLPDTTISINDSRVRKLKEFPNPSRYQSAFTDPKNNLLAMRITDTTSGSTVSQLEVYKISDAKNGNFNTKVHSYLFTSDMNSQILQGLALDGADFYVTFGQHAE